MREINAAWEVLRNPSARARYDDELKEQAAKAKEAPRVTSTSVFDNTGGEPGAAPPSPVRARPRVISLEPEDVADLAPADEPDASTGRPRWIRWGPVLIGGTVLVLVLVVAALGARPRGSSVRLQTVEEFAAGTCVDVIDPVTAQAPDAKPVLVSVPCSGVHHGRVVSVEAVPKPCPEGSRAFTHPSDDRRSVCVVAEP
jgi:hypothetical protein